MMALLGGSLQLVVSVPATGASSLLSLIRHERISVLWGVPALLRLLFESGTATDSLACLRLIRTFGDRLLAVDCDAWRKVLPATCHFGITYGQTESTISQWFVPRDFVPDGAVLPTGFLLPEHEYVILDDDRPASPEGGVGELVLRSRFVALGEWERGALVPGRMQRDPFDPRRRILRTGDLVRLRPDGLLEVIGRIDRQVKINGQRVEPAEIEDTLRRIVGVSDAVIAVKRDAGVTSLVAFVVSSDPDDPSILDRARASLRASLPSHMQPARMLLTRQLPLLPGGKVDHTALLKLEAATPESRRPAAAVPDSPHSRRLWLRPRRQAPAEGPNVTADARRAVMIAWRRVLGSPPAPGVTFLDAAGDSLRLLELVFALESRVDKQLPLAAFSVDATAEQMMVAFDTALRSPTLSPAKEKVFLLPGARGDTPGLAGLRADCLPRVPMQLVAYPDWREMLRARVTMDEIVQAAVAQIRAMSPPGSVGLVGYSFGAYVAYAASCILENEGRHIAQLVLIDMPPPHRSHELHEASPSTGPPAPSRRGIGLHRLAREIHWSVDRLTRAARQGAAAEWAGIHAATLIARLVRVRGVQSLASSRATQGWSRHFGDVGYWTSHHMGQEFRLRAAKDWLRTWQAPAKRLAAPLLLVRTGSPGQDVPEDLGWSALADRVRVVSVKGAHESMLSASHRKGVSAAVSAALASALSLREE
jgi:thioesterase domain-containing protein